MHHTAPPENDDIDHAPPSRDIPVSRPARRGAARKGRWLSPGPQAIAAGLLLCLMGGSIGYMLGAQQAAAPQPQALAPLPARSWLDDIAAAHRVYSRQQRHLTEVLPSEKAHIVEWLSQSVGVDFTLPDLAADKLEFQGARLLVADGKPVGQLVYRNDDGDIIAICFMKSAGPAQKLDETIKDDIGMISWATPAASYVVVGPSSEATLTTIADKVSKLL